MFFSWFHLDICPGVGKLDHIIDLFQVFKGTSILSSIVDVLIHIPTSNVLGCPFLHTLSSIYYLSTFGDVILAGVR